MGKHIPERMCIACRELFPKRELVRIVRSPTGEFDIDDNGKKPGRGAYICRNAACLKGAKKMRVLERSFKSGVPTEIYSRLEEIASAMSEAPSDG